MACDVEKKIQLEYGLKDYLFIEIIEFVVLFEMCSNMNRNQQNRKHFTPLKSLIHNIYRAIAWLLCGRAYVGFMSSRSFEMCGKEKN